MKNNSSSVITMLRFPLTVGVVFIHFNVTTRLIIGGVAYGQNNPGWYFDVVFFFSEVLPRIAVPLFFIISGFLFFKNGEFGIDIFKQKLKTRLFTLFIPYITWNILAVLLRLKCFFPFLSHFYSSHSVSIIISPLRLLNVFFNDNHQGGIIVSEEYDKFLDMYPANGPLWYIRDLIIVILLSPIIWWLLRKWGLLFITICGLLWFFIDPFILSQGGYARQFISALFFFAWGGYISVKRTDFVYSFRRFRWLSFLYPLIVIIDIYTKDPIIHKMGILCGIFFVVIITNYFLENNIVSITNKQKLLSNSSFFVYAMHYLVLSDIGKIVFLMLHIPDDSPLAMLLFYFFVPVIVILLCLGTYMIVKRCSPLAFKLLAGGR